MPQPKSALGGATFASKQARDNSLRREHLRYERQKRVIRHRKRVEREESTQEEFDGVCHRDYLTVCVLFALINHIRVERGELPYCPTVNSGELFDEMPYVAAC